MEFKWTEELEKDFIQLKKDFKNNNTRSFPIYKSKEPFVLTIDFSVLAIGVMLSQKQDDKEQLIAAAGRRTTPGERNYASWKGEYAALVYGIRKYEHILSYKTFVVKTDSMTLCHQPKIKPCTGIIARWTEYLAGFDFKVQHIAGKDNVVADAISRTPTHLDDPTKDEEEEAKDYAIHKIALAPRSQGPQNSLNLINSQEHSSKSPSKKISSWDRSSTGSKDLRSHLNTET